MSLLKEWQAQIANIAKEWPQRPELLSNTVNENQFPALELFGADLLGVLKRYIWHVCPRTYTLIRNDKALSQEWNNFLLKFLKENPISSYKPSITLSSLPSFLRKEHRLLGKYPFLADLAHYEWLLDFIFTFPDRPEPETIIFKIPDNKSLSSFVPVVNAAGGLFESYFCIPEIHASLGNNGYDLHDSIFSERKLSSYFIYRNVDTLQCQLFSLSDPLTKHLFLLCDGSRSYKEILDALFRQEAASQAYPYDVIEQQACTFFEACLKSNIIVGSLPIGVVI
jgi:hypothetical protein